VTCQTLRAIGAHNNSPTPLDLFFRVEAGIQTFLLVDKVWSTYPAVNQILYTNNSRASLPTGRRDKAGGGSAYCCIENRYPQELVSRPRICGDITVPDNVVIDLMR
jgi:hypothetical protein